MEFNSLEDINLHFNFDIKDVDSIRKKLKNLIKEVHPDQNEGEFKSETDKNRYHEIQSALDYLDKPNASLTVQNQITALTKIITELALIKKEEVTIDSVEKKGNSLSTKLTESVIAFHNHNKSPKITGLIITSVLTALWAFPSAIKDHPLLKILYNYNKEFTVIWIFSLIFTSILWIRIKSAERIDEETKKSYKLESTQNNIFLIFIRWMRIHHNNYEIKDNVVFINFTKDNLIDFLITRFRYFEVELNYLKVMPNYKMVEKIEEIEERYLTRKGLHTINMNKFFNLIPKAGEIDLEIAQIISDLIIERLIKKDFLIKLNSKSLSDTYQYEEKF